ncbi:MAG: 23S rRNA accumulation protein YceD [Methylomicrobium sp.]
MLDRLPELIDPLSFADKQSRLSGQIPLDHFERLKQLLTDDSGSVSIDLAFGRKGKLAIVEGHVRATLTLECQNCLNPIDLQVDCRVKLGIVGSMAEADRLPEEFEPLMVPKGKIPLKDIVEDEILLAIPSFPKHAEQCIATQDHADNSGIEKTDTNNPFLILAKLKQTGVK